MRFQLIALLVLAPFLSHCTPEETEVRISVTATDNDGNPVPKADIYLDHEKVGTTDVRGNFSKNIELGKKSKINVELKKDSDTHYFAPYIGQIETNDESNQAAKISAVLYSVPKPSFSDAAALAEEDAKANQEPVAVASETPPTELPAETKTQTQAKELADNSLIKAESQPTTELPEEVKTKIPPHSIYVTHGKNPLEGVGIYLGDESKAQLKKLCVTNKRGRCSFPAPENIDQAGIAIFAKKRGYVSKTTAIPFSPDGKTHLAMVRGESIEIFAVANTFSYIRGIKDVEVSIQGEPVGKTDRFGHFSYAFTGQKGDMVEVALERPGFLPEHYATDFIVAGPMTLVRHFSPKQAPVPRIAILPPRIAGSATSEELSAANNDALFAEIKKSAKQNLFSKGAFEEVPLVQIETAAKKAKTTLPQLIKNGWQKTGVKAVADAVIVPTVILGNQKSLELSLVNDAGKVLAATKTAFSSNAPVAKLFVDLSQNIMRGFPFEGAIAQKNGDKVEINLGSSPYGLKEGDELEVYGNQADKKGQKKSHTRIGRIKLDKVNENSSKASIVEQEPRALIAEGDSVILKERNQAPTTKKIQFRVSTKGDGEEAPISQANIYLDDAWLGATDENGELRIPNKERSSGVLRVIRYGYRDFTREWDPRELEKVSLHLEREMTLVRVDSLPQGASVRVDGKVLGKTPLNMPTAIAGGFVKLEITPEAGYKPFQKVIEFSEGALELTGPNAVKLEKDLRTPALKLLDQGKKELAIRELLAIPKEHSDYLLARHEAGEIFLTSFKKPEEASRMFAEVIADAAVKSYQDKRFIGSFINKAVADLSVVDNISDPKESAKLLLDVINSLNATEPHLRFIAADQITQATSHLAYYRALAHQKLWAATQDPRYLASSLRLWQKYVEQSEEAQTKQFPEMAGFLENARVYIRQAKLTNATKQQQSM